MHGDDATERKCAKCGAKLMDGELYPRLDFDREFCTDPYDLSYLRDVLDGDRP